jgi:hypothetical protein
MIAAEFLIFGVVALLVLGAATLDTVTTPAIAGPTTLDDDGTVCTEVAGELVPADPAGLAKGAGLDRQAYALARCIQSEASGATIVRRAVGHAVRNYCRAHGRTPLKLLTDVNGGRAGDGYFGRQDQGRYAATSRDPDDECRELAAAIVAGDDDDPTDGAEQWDSPQAYSSAGRADEIEARRLDAGNEKVILPGVRESVIRFWRPA